MIGNTCFRVGVVLLVSVITSFDREYILLDRSGQNLRKCLQDNETLKIGFKSYFNKKKLRCKQITEDDLRFLIHMFVLVQIIKT